MSIIVKNYIKNRLRGERRTPALIVYNIGAKWHILYSLFPVWLSYIMDNYVHTLLYTLVIYYGIISWYTYFFVTLCIHHVPCEVFFNRDTLYFFTAFSCDLSFFKIFIITITLFIIKRPFIYFFYFIYFYNFI